MNEQLLIGRYSRNSINVISGRVGLLIFKHLLITFYNFIQNKVIVFVKVIKETNNK